MGRNPISKGFRAVWNMKRSLPLTVRLLKDSRVDRLNKLAFLFVTVGYLVFPYDFIFDFPFFGQFDDLAVFLFMLNWFIHRTPKAILDEYGWREDMLKLNKKKDKKYKKEQKTVALHHALPYKRQKTNRG